MSSDKKYSPELSNYIPSARIQANITYWGKALSEFLTRSTPWSSADSGTHGRQTSLCLNTFLKPGFIGKHRLHLFFQNKVHYVLTIKLSHFELLIVSSNFLLQALRKRLKESVKITIKNQLVKITLEENN